jgi:hypothetical protein
VNREGDETPGKTDKNAAPGIGQTPEKALQYHKKRALPGEDEK